jgi:PEP-CTERM motif
MKKFVLAVLLLVGTAAYADTLTFTGSTANGVYGPYSLSLNGAPATPMICFSDNNWITGNESWTVQAYNITNVGTSLVGTVFGGSNVGVITPAGTTALYNELGYLGNELFADPGNAGLQQAIWAVLNPSEANSYNAAYFAFLATDPTYQTTDTFYIPVGKFTTDNGYPYGTPQPFISQVPEPSSLALLVTGMLALMLLVIRRCRA